MTLTRPGLGTDTLVHPFFREGCGNSAAQIHSAKRTKQRETAGLLSKQLIHKSINETFLEQACKYSPAQSTWLGINCYWISYSPVLFVRMLVVLEVCFRQKSLYFSDLAAFAPKTQALEWEANCYLRMAQPSQLLPFPFPSKLNQRK